MSPMQCRSGTEIRSVLGRGLFMSDKVAKIYTSMLQSAAWVGRPRPVKPTWITLLLLADVDGYAKAAIPGLARAAECTIPDVIDALEIFRREGRVTDSERGWCIVDFRKFVDHRLKGAAGAKIYTDMLHSSVWTMQKQHVKLVWLTLLLLADSAGHVHADLPGLAHSAECTLEETAEALERLQQP